MLQWASLPCLRALSYCNVLSCKPCHKIPASVRQTARLTCQQTCCLFGTTFVAHHAITTPPSARHTTDMHCNFTRDLFFMHPTLLSTISIRATPLVNHLRVSRLSSCHSNLSCQLSQSVPHHLSTIYGCHVSVRVIKIIRQTSYGCPASKFAALIRQTSYGCPASKFAALGPSRPDPLPPAVVCWPLRREPDMKGLFRSDLENFCGLF